MARSKALEAERELDKIYKEITRIKAKLPGEKRAKANEIEAKMYAGKLTPGEVLKEIRRLARS